MAKKYDDIGGVWRTIGGRRVFIKDGQSLSEAMIASGKFKNLRSDYRKAKEEEKEHKEDDEYALYKKAKENPDSIDPMTENSTDWEALEEKYKDRYDKENGNKNIKIEEKNKKEKISSGEYNKKLDDEYNKLKNKEITSEEYFKNTDDIQNKYTTDRIEKGQAKVKEENERLEIAKDIAKEVYGLNEKNASPERIEREAKKVLEYSDGEVLEKGDQPYTNSKGELERSTKSLKEWRDELKKTSENKDGFTQQTDMYGGTYEYTQQRLNEMKEHGTKPLEHSYTGGGWQGLKYDSTLSTKDIAKNIGDYSKKEFPDVKLSRKTDYNGIDMYVMSSDKDMFVSEKDIDNMNFSDLEQVTRSNGFNWWAKENVKDYNTNHSYSIDDVRKYAKEQLNTTKSHDSNPSSDSWYLSDYGKKVISGLNKEMNSYNYDDSDGTVDYFDTNFYGYVHIGKWDKPYQVNQKSSVSDINGAIRQKAYQKYLKEHPNSKITFEDFKDMRK